MDEQRKLKILKADRDRLVLPRKRLTFLINDTAPHRFIDDVCYLVYIIFMYVANALLPGKARFRSKTS